MRRKEQRQENHLQTRRWVMMVRGLCMVRFIFDITLMLGIKRLKVDQNSEEYFSELINGDQVH